ncbi:hypothetical protein LN042_21100 [Kitasatospora sp. RB6PN24]|uniref:hypothetical protein n=1 Tax=Kitasatospora humi TaxID=2893891 RepID=UPI001E427FC3|nr:hypothetical protein [Kitasatospora humi]MCC9309544.1 hypothetical protein [Kitasatospora humi]
MPSVLIVRRERPRALPRPHPLIALPAALLCLAVVWIHVQDQGGFPGSKSPRYVGIGYYLLEVGGVLAAAVLVGYAARPLARSALPWLLAGGIAAGPLIGYLLSRGPGLPAYTDDRGNWTEPLGLAGLAVEATLLAVTAVALRLHRRARGPGVGDHG